MRSLISSVLLFISIISFCQSPKLYIQIVSHNEPNDNLQIALNYNRAKTYTLQLAAIVNSKNAKWNLQTSDGFVLGALNDEASTSTNVFKTLANAPYNDNVEIDPRYKNTGGRNIADQWHLLDSLGANPSHNLGGFIYSTTNASLAPIDWEPYRNPIIGNIYHNSWQCNTLCGAGSYPPHDNDLNDFGIFKPDAATNFYHHNPSKNLWCVGTGCAPVLDSLSDENAIITQIRQEVDSIMSGKWPSNKFYVSRIMTNQREYGPLFLQKISKVIDSINAMPAAGIQWATIDESLTAFLNWRTTSGIDYSQWMCGQVATDISSPEGINTLSIYPNPSEGLLQVQLEDEKEHLIKVLDIMGKQCFSGTLKSHDSIDLSMLNKGLYFIQIDEMHVSRWIKE